MLTSQTMLFLNFVPFSIIRINSLKVFNVLLSMNLKYNSFSEIALLTKAKDKGLSRLIENMGIIDYNTYL